MSISESDGSALICKRRHAVSTGSGSDRVIILTIAILVISGNPVATAPGTDLISRLGHYQSDL